MEKALEFFKDHGPMTAPGGRAAELRALPSGLAALCEVVQAVLIHRDQAPFFYALKLPPERYDEANLRTTAAMLTKISALDARPLGAAREPRARMAVVCRHFAVMLSAILREKGIPARARCGFGGYFMPGKFEDHWVCEYWNAAQARWILVDAQLDAIQRKAFRIDLDPLDVARDRFVIAGDAWQMCRAGRADPSRYGLSFINESGLWFIAQNLLRDLASLNRMEMLPWDVWGSMREPEVPLIDNDLALFDRAAALTMGGDAAFPEIRTIYESDERLRVPAVVFNASRQVREPVLS
ncbi:MAG TPA: transglutaminase domain-containing protein [Candidatus Binataceae bacterium]|nr:transglutaminase domain-containing protein [Candidatus Binataceae bacterium]